MLPVGPEQEHSTMHSLISAFTSFHFQKSEEGDGKGKNQPNPQFLPAGCEYHTGCRQENVLAELVH